MSCFDIYKNNQYCTSNEDCSCSDCDVIQGLCGECDPINREIYIGNCLRNKIINTTLGKKKKN